MKQILLSLIVVGLVAMLAFSWTSAYFSDDEMSESNTFEAGAIDLKIGNESYYNGVLQDGSGETAITSFELGDLIIEKFFDFNDIKPSDWGEDTIELVVDTNDAWACFEVQITSDDDVNCTEPESLDDAECNEPNQDEFDGELASQVEFIFWVDDGDNVLEEGERLLTQGKAEDILDGWKVAFADSEVNNLGGDNGEPMIGQASYFIGKAWCFGDLSPQPLPQTNDHSPTIDPGVLCDGSLLDNSAQTDILTGDIRFTAIQARNNPNFVCPSGPDYSCESVETTYANSVANSTQGTLKNGNPISDPNRTDSNHTLGTPNSQFFSIGKDGEIVVEFDMPIVDEDGPDVSIHEVTNGRPSYPEERAEIFVSSDGTSFISLGVASSNTSGDGISYFDIGGLVQYVTHVKIADQTDFDLHNNNADGFDLDAVDAVNGLCVEL